MLFYNNPAQWCDRKPTRENTFSHTTPVHFNEELTLTLFYGPRE